jgi:hypothetical protein
VAFLTPESFDLYNREALHADVLKRFFYFVEFKRLDDGFDLFHFDTRWFDCRMGISLFNRPGNSSSVGTRWNAAGIPKFA